MVRVYYYYDDKNVRYYDSDPSMWHDGVLSMSGFVSDPSERWPANKFYMYFYKDYNMTPGLNHPEDGTERRFITLRLNHSFPVEWVNYARDYINTSDVYRPGIFTHTNWVVVNGVRAMDAFNTQPAYIYKHVINNGNYKGLNPVCTIRLGNSESESGEEIGITYPVYRFSVSVNGIYSNDPIVIDDNFDTSLFKLFDKRDFGNASQTYVEEMTNGVHKLAWINWIMPQFGANPEISWNGAGGNSALDDYTSESFKGVFYRTDNQNADPSMNHTTDVFKNGRRVISNDDVCAEETENGLRFTFKNLDKFRKSNGQYYNFYTVDYYLIPRSKEALAEIERRVAAANPPLTNGTVETTPSTTLATVPIVNTATFRGNTTSAVTYLFHKNNIYPVKKTCKKTENETSEYAQLHPKYQFEININPGRIALNSGQEMQVTDTYSSSLAVDFRSVKVITYPAGKEKEVTYDYSGNVGRFIIPDNTHVIITYDARISEAPAEDTDFVPFDNTVVVSGLSARVVDSSEIKVKSNGEAIIPEIFIFKYRTNHMEQGLNGAVFNLYEALKNENGEEILDENGNKTYIPIQVDNEDFQMVSAYDPDTKKNGQIHLKLDLQQHGFNLDANKYYYIHEERPPTGYIASDVYYQFMIRTDGKVDYSQREYLLGDTLTVRNSPDSVNLNLVKTIKGNVTLTNKDLALLSFTLEKQNEKTGSWEPYGENDTISYSDLTVTSQTDPGSNEPQETTAKIVFKNLSRGKYKLTESGNSNILKNHSGAKSYVKYEIDDNKNGSTASAEFEITQDLLDNDQDRTVTFTNTFSKDTVDRKATKKWYDVEGNEINWPKGVKIKLNVVPIDGNQPGDTVVKSVELDGTADDNGELIAGTASFIGLPKYKNDGTTIQQYAVVEETSLNGFEQDKAFYKLPDSNAVIIKNTKRSTSLSVTKKWLGAVPENATATLRLWGYPQQGSVSEAKLLKELTVTSTQNCEIDPAVTDGSQWLVTFDNVPVTNDFDVPLQYFFTEESCSPGYEPSYPSNGTSAAVGGVITNSIGKTSFSLTKQWKNTAGNLWPVDKISDKIVDKLIELTIRRSKAGTLDNSFSIVCNMTSTTCQPQGNLPAGASASYSHNGNGKYYLEIKGLDKYAPDGTPWDYYATEKEIENFTAVYEDQTHADVTNSLKHAPNGGYIMNTGKVYSLTVSKNVTGNFGDKQYYFTYTLHIEDEGGTPFEGTLKYKKTGAPSGDVDNKLTIIGGNAAFTLCHNESITFAAIPGTLIYSVTEERSGARGYTVHSSANGTPYRQSDSPYVIYGPISDSGKILSDQRISYSNDRSRIIPTGVGLEVGGSMALFLMFTLALAVIMLRRKTDSNED